MVEKTRRALTILQQREDVRPCPADGERVEQSPDQLTHMHIRIYLKKYNLQQQKLIEQTRQLNLLQILKNRKSELPEP